MNWLALSHKHPNTMVKFRNWAWQNNVGFEPHIRHLYDFFDEQGIGVFVEWGIDQTDHGKLIYRYKILHGEELNCALGLRHYSTRTEAEEQAFIRAFEILEQKLKEGK